jgi:hypothetical protein
VIKSLRCDGGMKMEGGSNGNGYGGAGSRGRSVENGD